MRKKPALWITIGVLGLGLGIAVFYPETRPSSHATVEVDAPETLKLTGIVRDFRKAHSDFAVSGSGHVAGAVEVWLPGSKRPVLATTGYAVETQWRDRVNHPIAPHIAGVRGGMGGGGNLGLWVNGKIEMKEETHIDAFNSNYGRYGERGNYGAKAVVSTNSIQEKSVKVDKKAVLRGDVNVGPGASPSYVIENKGVITGSMRSLDEPYDIPELTLPDDLDPYQDHVHLEGPVILTGDTNADDDVEVPAMHFGRLHLKDDSVITIEGDLRILCENELTISKSQIRLRPEANLTFYVRSGKVEIKDGALINTDVGNTSLVSFNILGQGYLKVEKDSHVYATIIAPQRKLEIKKAHVYGAFIGEALEVKDKGGAFHVDLGNSTLGPWNYALTLRDKIEVEDHSTIDSFDSNLGPYGEGNSDDDAFVTTNAVKKDHVKIKKHSKVKGDVLVGPGALPYKVIKLEDHSSITGMQGALALPRPIPVVSPPTMGESVGEIHHHSGDHTLTSDVRCKKLKLHEGATLTIVGDITIRCDDKVELKKNSEIRLAPNSSLILYVKKDVKIEENSKFNVNTGNPQLVSIRRTSVGKKGKIEIKKKSQLVAWVQGAKTEMKVEDHSQFFGSFAGEKLKLKGHSKFHVDMAYLGSCVAIADQAGQLGDPATAEITSSASFDQWFRDVLGVNQSMAHILELTDVGGGVYSYENSSFYPIDGRLYGNETESHNNNFSYTINGTFCYTDCASQFLEIEGGDGTWVYINNNLVIDLGGVSPEDEQYIDVDRLGLDDGETYPINIFYTQRRSSPSPLRLRTNMLLSTASSVPSVTAQYD